MVGCSQETVPTKASQLCQLTAAILNLKMKTAQLAFGIRTVICATSRRSLFRKKESKRCSATARKERLNSLPLTFTSFGKFGIYGVRMCQSCLESRRNWDICVDRLGCSAMFCPSQTQVNPPSSSGQQATVDLLGKRCSWS